MFQNEQINEQKWIDNIKNTTSQMSWGLRIIVSMGHIAFTALCVKSIWNWTLLSFFGLPKMTFVNALGIIIIVLILNLYCQLLTKYF